jgi:hypothetical protein
MDIDFVESLFASDYHFLNKNISNWNPFKRIHLHDVNLKMQHYLYPPLSEYYFAKRGYYNTSEYLNDNVLKLIIKRAYRYRLKRRFVGNFVLDKWFENYVRTEINSLDREILNSIFNLDKLYGSFTRQEYGTEESSWRRYTNLISLNKTIHFYQ